MIDLNYDHHKPVLLDEVLQFLQPKDGEVYVDGTFGAGGYSAAILAAANCQVYAFDRDSSVGNFALVLQNKFPERFNFINRKFSDIRDVLVAKGVNEVDGLVLDLGVSSMQLDQDHRGFSFNSDSKLDMRMGVGAIIDASELVNHMSEIDLARIIADFGEEKKAKIIAKRIVEAREIKKIETGLELATIIRRVYGNKIGRIDPATKTFQAIRIYVNDELEELRKVLYSAKDLLRKGGRLIVVSFHSLEDSIVKSFLRQESGYNDRNFSRYDPWPIEEVTKRPSFALPSPSSIKPRECELRLNFRSRSARMRIGVKN